MGMSTGGGGSTMSEINVTPLVDVMLVLLIIFMVTAPMLNQGVNIELPEEITPLDQPDEESSDVYLTVQEDLSILFKQGKTDAATIQPAEVHARLLAVAATDPDTPIFLEAAGTVPYKKVAFLLASAQQAGLKKIGMVFEPVGAEP